MSHKSHERKKKFFTFLLFAEEEEEINFIFIKMSEIVRKSHKILTAVENCSTCNM